MALKRTGIAALAAAAVTSALLPLAASTSANAAPAAPAAVSSQAAAKAKLKLSTTKVKKGTKVKLTGTKFPKKATNLYITICGYPAGATNCDQDLRGGNVKQYAYKGKGKFKTTYKVGRTSFITGSGKIDCKKKQCVIGTTNAINPKDRTYNTQVKIKVKK